MLYEILKPIVNVYYHVYYKLEVNSLKHIPCNKPLVLSPNHTNGFIDPISIGVIIKNKVRFFARGDVFKGRLAKAVLNDLNMSPMYRLQEGYGEIKKNNKTFEECKDLLSNNKTLLIFPEAICIPEKRLQPLKKGLSRIVFQTEELFEFKKKVLILPIGLNYTAAKKFRSDLYINFGKPISLGDYEERYKENKVKTINQFTKDLEDEMRLLIIQISNKENDELMDGIHEIYLYQWMKAKRREVNSVEKRYESRKEIVEMMNEVDERYPEAVSLLREKVKQYLKNLNKHQLRDHLLNPEIVEQSGIGKFFYEFFALWFGLPLYAMALLIHGLPLYIAKKFSDEKIKQAEFYASIRANMGMLLWLLVFFIQLLIVAFTFRSWLLLGVYIVVAALLAKFALSFYSFRKKVFGRWRLLRLVRTNRKTVEELVAERAAIIRSLNEFKER